MTQHIVVKYAIFAIILLGNFQHTKLNRNTNLYNHYLDHIDKSLGYTDHQTLYPLRSHTGNCPESIRSCIQVHHFHLSSDLYHHTADVQVYSSLSLVQLLFHWCILNQKSVVKVYLTKKLFRSIS